jgi:phosphoribosylformylglycinamidine synthase I
MPAYSISPRVLLLHAPGTNRDGDLAHAIHLAGGHPEITPLSVLRDGDRDWHEFAMLALPGGFSYADALGAGRLWALDLQTWLSDFLNAFVSSGRPVIGICNGFQALVKAGILPGNGQMATLTNNASGYFECRWVSLVPNLANPSPWLDGLSNILCPVAHGEGRFLMDKAQELPAHQLALKYSLPDGTSADGSYPANPNGSPGDVAGITNPAGNVLGLMPHPEDHIHTLQHPRWSRHESGGLGLALFQNGLRMAS